MVRSSRKARSRGRFSQPTSLELRAAVADYYKAVTAPVEAPDGRLQVVSSESGMKRAVAQHLLGVPGYADAADAVGKALRKQSLAPKQLHLGRTLCNVLCEDLLFDVGPVVDSQRQIKLNVQALASATQVIGPAAKKTKTGHGVDATAGASAAAAVARLMPAVHDERNGVPAATAAGQAAAADASTPTAGPIQLMPPAAQTALAAAFVPRDPPTPHNLAGHEPGVSSSYHLQRMKMITSMLDFGTAVVKAGAASLRRCDTVLQYMPLEDAKQLAASTHPKI